MPRISVIRKRDGKAGEWRDAMVGFTWLPHGLRIGLALVFVWAGAAKLVDPRAFARVISGYGLLPEEFLVPVAVGLPALEFIAGLGLLLDVRGSLETILGLLFMFLLVLGFAVVQNLDVDCGCFSQDEMQSQNSLRLAFARDVGMLVITLFLLVRKRLGTPRAASRASPTASSKNLKEELA